MLGPLRVSRAAQLLVLLALADPTAAVAQGAELTPPPGSQTGAASPPPPASPATPSSAQPDPSSAGDTQGGVAFGAIDRATVRVFAVSDVGHDTVRGRFHPRVIGIPEAGHGTGVVVDPRGVIVTAKHVVEGARHVAVRLPGDDGAVLPAIVVYQDDTLDFAIVLVKTPSPLTAITLPEGAPQLRVRQTVDAIGYPFDADRRQPQSARGIISGVLDDGHLQLDMSLNPGNSGGPLLDESETLVGIVVARADPTSGAQGIGIAVPIAPVRAAFDRARRGGRLSNAYRSLRANAEEKARSAEVVDDLVRLGGLDLLQEAADFVDSPEASQRIDRLRAMAERTQNADLLALPAAYFWDAAQVMVERAGGYVNPSRMPAGPARDLADDLWRRSIDVANRARRADPSVVQRSPFIGYLTGAPASAQGAIPYNSVQGVSGERAPRRPRDSRERMRWSPWVHLGPAYSFNSEADGAGFGIRLSVLLPFGGGGGKTGFKFRLVGGGTLDVGMHAGSASYFGGSDLGFALRGGGEKVGVAIFAFWSQGIYRGPFDCGRFGGSPCIGSEWTPIGVHVGFSLKIRDFHIGFSVRWLRFSYSTVTTLALPELSWRF